MLEPRRIYSETAPKALEDLGSGNWYYNYDIKSENRTMPPIEEGGTPIEVTVYDYIQIKMTGKPDYKRCVEAVIRKYITQNQEFDLINSYNRASFNLLSEEEAEKAGTEYVEYLDKLTEIKAAVKKDFK